MACRDFQRAPHLASRFSVALRSPSLAASLPEGHERQRDLRFVSLEPTTLWVSIAVDASTHATIAHALILISRWSMQPYR